jgi:hypothetical protein
MSDAIATAGPIVGDFFRSTSPAIAAIAGAAVVTFLLALIDGLSARTAIFSQRQWLLDLFRGGAIQAGRATESAIKEAGKK